VGVQAYIKAVARHWRVVAIAVVSLIGNAATVIGGFGVPRWVWWICAVGALVVAQYRAYSDLAAESANARARLGQLGSVDAQRAFVDRAIEQATEFLADLNDPATRGTHTVESGMGDRDELNRIRLDIGHWEDNLRAAIRSISGREAARRLDLNNEGQPDHIDADMLLSAHRDYVHRRIRRLEEWKATL
jgi:hypothetical protein